VCDTRDVIKIDAYGTSRVFQQRSNSSDIAVVQWKSFDEYWNIFNPVYISAENALMIHKPVELAFDAIDHIDKSNIAYITKNNLCKSGKHFYPQIFCFGDQQLTDVDLKFFEIMLLTLPKFCSQLERIDPYNMKAHEVFEDVVSGSGEVVNVKISCPAGSNPVSNERYDLVLEEVLEVVTIPSRVKTYGDLADYFREICGVTALPEQSYLEKMNSSELKRRLKNCKINVTGCLDREDLLSAAQTQRPNIHLSDAALLKLIGLSNSIWKLRSVETTREAIELLQKVLKIDNRGDRFALRFHLLLYFLELEDWGACRELIDTYSEKDERTTDWAWTKAFIEFRAHGGESTIANQALFDAVNANGLVVKYLTADSIDILNSDMNVFVSLNEDSKNREMEAKHYAEEYNCFWRRAKGAIEWMRMLAPHYRQQLDDGQDVCTVISLVTDKSKVLPVPVDTIELD